MLSFEANFRLIYFCSLYFEGKDLRKYEFVGNHQQERGKELVEWLDGEALSPLTLSVDDSKVIYVMHK